MKIKLPKPKDRMGYSDGEIKKICDTYNIALPVFWEYFGIQTCSMGKNRKPLYYACDVDLTLRVCLKERGVLEQRWD